MRIKVNIDVTVEYVGDGDVAVLEAIDRIESAIEVPTEALARISVNGWTTNSTAKEDTPS